MRNEGDVSASCRPAFLRSEKSRKSYHLRVCYNSSVGKGSQLHEEPAHPHSKARSIERASDLERRPFGYRKQKVDEVANIDENTGADHEKAEGRGTQRFIERNQNQEGGSSTLKSGLAHDAEKGPVILYVVRLLYPEGGTQT